MKPVLFNTTMVRAIQEDRKTVTRRVIKYSCPAKPGSTLDDFIGAGDPQLLVGCSPYQPGDILWVRETWKPVSATVDFWEMGGPTAIDDGFGYQYKADGKVFWRGDFKPQNDEFHTTEIRYGEKWRPSIHMPKEAARLFLRVTAVRVERLQDITFGETQDEGIWQPKDYPGREDLDIFGPFAVLWDSTIKHADLHLFGWDANPWVWVIEFGRISREAALAGGDGDGA